MTEQNGNKIRDQTDIRKESRENLETRLKKLYKSIDQYYDFSRKATNIDDARFYIDQAFRARAKIAAIDLELCRRGTFYE